MLIEIIKETNLECLTPDMAERLLSLYVKGGPQPANIERAHIRMSMAGSHTSRAFKKQFGTVQSLYGIPEESGWSIPVPAHHSHLTRTNVHAVFYTCNNLDAATAAEVTTPKIEFRQDDFPFIFPNLEIGSLVFLLGLLANKLEWVKISTMEVLKLC